MRQLSKVSIARRIASASVGDAATIAPQRGGRAGLLQWPRATDNGAMKRRWHQFRLRTLLIGVTLLAAACGYVGWQLKIVNQRKATLIRLDTLGGASVTVNEYLSAVAHGWKSDLRNEELPTIPWPRSWLGDVAVIQIYIPESVGQSDVEEFIRAFPESRVIRP
jgi:hypothetical protein